MLGAAGLYRKLKKNRIRVIKIKYENGNLSGTLQTVSLPSEGRKTLYSTVHNHMQQELWLEKRWAALSYVWGDPTPTRAFILNGTKIMIHLNLYQALRQYCRHDSVYPVWTDFLCINQADQQDVRRHIHMMDRIYLHAYVVYSYLGESNEYTQAAVDLLTELHPLIQSGVDEFIQECSNSGQSTWIGNAPWMRAILPPQDQQDGIAQEIFSIFYNEYFFRIWTLQENVLARHQYIQRGSVEVDVTILYDYFCHFSWRVAVFMAFFNSLPQLKQFDFNRLLIPWPFIRSICSADDKNDEDAKSSSQNDWPERRSLYKRSVSRLLDTSSWLTAKYSKRFRGPDDLWYTEDIDNPSYNVLDSLLTYSFELECTKPEDRCLGLMGLVRWGARRKMGVGRWSHVLEGLPGILDTKSVFMAFAMAMMHGRNGMIVLSWAAYSHRQVDHDLPSWCPNFHQMSGYTLKQTYERMLFPFQLIEQDEKPIVSYDEPDESLSSCGIRIDTVTRCMDLTWNEVGGHNISKIGSEQQLDLGDIRAEAAIDFLKALWNYFQQAVRTSPRVKQSYREKIEHGSVYEAGISFISCLLRSEDDFETLTETDTQSLIEFIKELKTITATMKASNKSGSEAQDSSLLASDPSADKMLGYLYLQGDHYFFVTDNGYFGSCTTQVRQGDQLVILAGAKNPFVLRPMSITTTFADTKTKWRLVGEAFVSELTSRGIYINELDPPSLWLSTFRAERPESESEAETHTSVHDVPQMTLRWQASKPFEPATMRIEGHDYHVPPIEATSETFIII